MRRATVSTLMDGYRNLLHADSSTLVHKTTVLQSQADKWWRVCAHNKAQGRRRLPEAVRVESKGYVPILREARVRSACHQESCEGRPGWRGIVGCKHHILRSQARGPAFFTRTLIKCSARRCKERRMPWLSCADIEVMQCCEDAGLFHRAQRSHSDAGTTGQDGVPNIRSAALNRIFTQHQQGYSAAGSTSSRRYLAGWGTLIDTRSLL